MLLVLERLFHNNARFGVRKDCGHLWPQHNPNIELRKLVIYRFFLLWKVLEFNSWSRNLILRTSKPILIHFSISITYVLLYVQLQIRKNPNKGDHGRTICMFQTENISPNISKIMWNFFLKNYVCKYANSLPSSECLKIQLHISTYKLLFGMGLFVTKKAVLRNQL